MTGSCNNFRVFCTYIFNKHKVPGQPGMMHICIDINLLGLIKACSETLMGNTQDFLIASRGVTKRKHKYVVRIIDVSPKANHLHCLPSWQRLTETHATQSSDWVVRKLLSQRSPRNCFKSTRPFSSFRWWSLGTRLPSPLSCI